MPDPRGNFSLEELLRAKREDRPEEAFWNRFDREFKAKQRRLLQKQIVDHEPLGSPLAKRLNRLLLASGTLGFAAFATILTIRMDSESSSSVAADSGSVSDAATPAFAVNQPEASLRAESGAAPALAEFTAFGHAPRPRIVVETLRPESPRPSGPTIARAETKRTANERTVASASAQRLSSRPATFNADALSVQLDSATSDEQSSMERYYYLGKYADPLGDDFTANFETARAPRSDFGMPDSRRVPDLDSFPSNQGSRAERALDKLTVRF